MLFWLLCWFSAPPGASAASAQHTPPAAAPKSVPLHDFLPRSLPPAHCGLVSCSLSFSVSFDACGLVFFPSLSFATFSVIECFCLFFAHSLSAHASLQFVVAVSFLSFSLCSSVLLSALSLRMCFLCHTIYLLEIPFVLRTSSSSHPIPCHSNFHFHSIPCRFIFVVFLFLAPALHFFDSFIPFSFSSFIFSIQFQSLTCLCVCVCSMCRCVGLGSGLLCC